MNSIRQMAKAHRVAISCNTTPFEHDESVPSASHGNPSRLAYNDQAGEDGSPVLELRLEDNLVPRLPMSGRAGAVMAAALSLNVPRHMTLRGIATEPSRCRRMTGLSMSRIELHKHPPRLIDTVGHATMSHALWTSSDERTIGADSWQHIQDHCECVEELCIEAWRHSRHPIQRIKQRSVIGDMVAIDQRQHRIVRRSS